MHSYTKGAAALLSIMGFTVVCGCRDADGPETALTAAQVAGTYALQTVNGDPPPYVLRSTYAGTFEDDAGIWPPTPIIIDTYGELTLQRGPDATITFVGPRDPPGSYTRVPSSQSAYPNWESIVQGSFVIQGDGTCSFTSWIGVPSPSGSVNSKASENTMPGSCSLTHDLIEWTSASLVLTAAGTWTAEITQRAVPGATTSYSEAGTFRSDGSHIVFSPAFLHADPGCTATATLEGDGLTAAEQCRGIARPGPTSVWRR